MGDFLTSVDLHVGLNDLGQPMLVDLTEANNSKPIKQPNYLLETDLCCSSNLPNSD